MLVLCVPLAWAPPARAETLRYAIAVPDGQAVTYLLDLDVRHPGTLSVRAQWSGPRSLSLRLVPPERPWGTVHRAGPSPQMLETLVVDELGGWTLRVHSLAADGGGAGTVIIELPEARPKASGPAAAQPPPVPTPPPEPWMVAQLVPPDAPRAWAPFLRATERLREAIVGDPAGAPADACQWQAPLMRYLDRRRESLRGGGATPAESTARMLARISRTVRSVEELRTSDDPLLVGPPPRDPHLRDAWVKLRTAKVQPVESELDRILTMVRRDFASELTEEDWPARYVSCLTACERYFEQRARVGERRARNRELARAQWSTILTAAEALAALSELTPTDRAAGHPASP